MKTATILYTILGETATILYTILGETATILYTILGGVEGTSIEDSDHPKHNTRGCRRNVH